MAVDDVMPSSSRREQAGSQRLQDQGRIVAAEPEGIQQRHLERPLLSLPGDARQRALRIGIVLIDRRMDLTGREGQDAGYRSDGAGRGYVWKYEAGKFVAIAVVTGVADERWTEVTAGQIQPGDRLVTHVQIPRP